MLKVEEARKIILENTQQLEAEKVEILSSMNRVLAEDIYATLDLHPFDNSAMDGYAVISSDTAGVSRTEPKVLEVLEDVPAGYVASKELKKGKAIRIMTGAPIPSGADAVVIVEVTEREQRAESKEQRVRIFQEVKEGENIRRKGEDVKKGELVIPKGKTIRPQEIGMFASLNINEVNVIRRPQVAILSTGDELVELGQDLGPGKIRNSNSYSLYAQVLKYGGIPVNLGIAKDTKEEIRNKIKSVICLDPSTICDILIISGGVSVGDYDFVKDVLTELKMETKFWRVAIKPGKPLLFGILQPQRTQRDTEKHGEIGVAELARRQQGIPVFGLPGNPAASMVTFEQFVGQALLKMQGKTEGVAELARRQLIRAISEENIKKTPGKKYFIRGIVSQKNGQYFVKPSGSQSSGILKSMILANGLIIIPEEVAQVNKGEEVQVELL